MATYLELRGLYQNDDLRSRLEVAITVAAHALVTGTPTVQDSAWASRALANPRAEAEKALRFVLADNRAATTTQILAANDATLQAKVALVVPALVAAS